NKIVAFFAIELICRPEIAVNPVITCTTVDKVTFRCAPDIIVAPAANRRTKARAAARLHQIEIEEFIRICAEQHLWVCGCSRRWRGVIEGDAEVAFLPVLNADL